MSTPNVHRWQAQITVTTTDAGIIMDAFADFRDSLERVLTPGEGYDISLVDSGGDEILALTGSR